MAFSIGSRATSGRGYRLPDAGRAATRARSEDLSAERTEVERVEAVVAGESAVEVLGGGGAREVVGAGSSGHGHDAGAGGAGGDVAASLEPATRRIDRMVRVVSDRLRQSRGVTAASKTRTAGSSALVGSPPREKLHTRTAVANSRCCRWDESIASCFFTVAAFPDRPGAPSARCDPATYPAMAVCCAMMEAILPRKV